MVVAVYGAIIGTYNLIIRVRDRASRVKVRVFNGFVTDNADLSDVMLIREAANIGNRTVTLSAQGYELPDQKQLVSLMPQSNVTFPYDLEPGKNCLTWGEIRKEARSLRESGYKGKVNLVGFYRDQTGKTYRSSPYELDVDKWAEAS